jgi:hypothetical protein
VPSAPRPPAAPPRPPSGRPSSLSAAVDNARGRAMLGQQQALLSRLSGRQTVEVCGGGIVREGVRDCPLPTPSWVG